MTDAVLFIPRFGNGHGLGHLKRTLKTAQSMGNNAWVYFEKGGKDDRLTAILNSVQIVENPWEEIPWKLVIIDRRKTSVKELNFYEKLGPVIGIDEGGNARAYTPYLIDSLGNKVQREKPNTVVAPISDINANNIKSCKKLKQFKKILISFGGEDPTGLTMTLLRKLKTDNFFNDLDISVVEGPLFKSHVYTKDIHVIRHPDSLLNIIPEYDLVITSYGLTCFEAICSGVPFILFNPTRYHRKLARIFSFPEIGVGKPNIRKLRILLRKQTQLLRFVEEWRGKLLNLKRIKGTSFKKFIFSGNMRCPVCGQLNRAIARFENRTYFSCSKCGIIYSSVFNESRKIYNKEYFYKEYRNQYGKTYLEDFNLIKKIGYERIRIIEDIIRTNNRELLDVGCAFGPFLDAARDMAYSPSGIDISREAVDYTVNKLGIKASNVDFMNFSGGIFNIITMWYVIEHFEKLSEVLKKVNRHLKRGGIFAFSTPNYRGISGRRNLMKFLSLSPLDHYTVWSPKAAVSIMKNYGFRVVRIRVTGHHPDRFPLYNRLLNGIYSTISRLFKLGDTFEVYTEKIKDL